MIELAFEACLLLRDRVNKALEKARKDKIIGKNEDAYVEILNQPKETLPIREDELRELLKVSELWLVRDEGGGAEVITVCHCKDKGYLWCERCRRWYDHLYHGSLCNRCWEAVRRLDTPRNDQ